MAFATSKNPTIWTPSTLIWIQIKPKSPNNQPFNIPKARNSCIRNRVRESLFISCSTKEDFDEDNEKQRILDARASSNSRIQGPSTTSGSNPAQLSSLNTKGLIFDLGCKDSWDDAEIGSPVVKRFLGDEEDRWYMWYHGSSNVSPSKYSIGLAVSSNGVHWERGREGVRSNADVGLVMNCSTDWWAFDTQGIMPNEVIIMSSSKVKSSNAFYWLYYTGFNSDKINKIENLLKVRNDISSTGALKSLPGLAMSQDRRHWARIEGDHHTGALKSLPGLALSQDGRHWARIEGDHHTGALFDVGSKSEWDSSFIASPKVVFHGNNDLRMYYHSYDEEQGLYSIGMARSKDGIQWVKLGKILEKGDKGTFDELGVMNPQVVRDKKLGQYVMVYEGVDINGIKSIGLAISLNGLSDWTRYQECPLLKKSENGWDCEDVGSPYIVQMDDINEWRLYYVGIGKEGKARIGLAISCGSRFSSFERWTN